MGGWNRYWHGPVAAVRAWVVLNGILLLLAFDVWVQSLRTAARYGSGAFNVAHFAWLDAVQPLPSVGRIQASAARSTAAAAPSSRRWSSGTVSCQIEMPCLGNAVNAAKRALRSPSASAGTARTPRRAAR